MKSKWLYLSPIIKDNSYARVLFFSIFAFISLATASFAAPPSLFFSDMTDGPTTGWEGSSVKGVAVSIWGTNLGNTRGISTVNVCGVNLNKDTDFAEWGATTNPTTARGMRRITFWLNSNMTTGTNSGITVTTPNGTSATIPFHCRALGSNKIYFVSRTGSNSNNGLYSASSSGSNGPWFSASKVINLQAGDVAYFRSGVWTEVHAWDSIIDFWSNVPHGNGTANKSITIASYPGEMAQLGDGNSGGAIGHHGGSGDTLNYWTFSKFKMIGQVNAINWGTGQPNSDDHIRFIGNDASTGYASGKTIFSFHAGTGGQTNLVVYGNYLCDAGVDTRGQVAKDRGYGFYMGGYGWHDGIDFGWNEIAYNSHGRGIQIYGHTVTDWIDNLYIHDNYIHHNSMTGMILSGGDGAGGSYAYEFTKNAWVYNNIICCGGDNSMNPNPGTYPAMLIGGVMHGGNGGNFHIYNNTIYDYQETAISIDGNPLSVTLKNNIFYVKSGKSYYSSDNHPEVMTAANNLYFNGTGVPQWDTHPIAGDPLFVSGSPVSYVDFQLQISSSPAKDNGTAISLVTRDFNGIARPQNYALDIGAFEVSNATADISAPVAPIIKTIIRGTH